MNESKNGAYTVSSGHWLSASHFLPETGEEQEHIHDYRIVFTCEGKTLDRHGYLVDIRELKKNAREMLFQFHNQLLNEMEEFGSIPPSIENLARLFCLAMWERLDKTGISALTASVAENDDSRASYRRER